MNSRALVQDHDPGTSQLDEPQFTKMYEIADRAFLTRASEVLLTQAVSGFFALLTKPSKRYGHNENQSKCLGQGTQVIC
jgi:hypothetical protein